jgi:hypothetical protein
MSVAAGLQNTKQNSDHLAHDQVDLRHERFVLKHNPKTLKKMISNGLVATVKQVDHGMWLYTFTTGQKMYGSIDPNHNPFLPHAMI